MCNRLAFKYRCFVIINLRAKDKLKAFKMLKFIILICVRNLISGFKHLNICIQIESNCKSISVTDMRLNCIKLEFSGRFKHQCGSTHCSVDINGCDTFRNFNSYLIGSFMIPIMPSKQIKIDLDKIENCPIFKWNETDKKIEIVFIKMYHLKRLIFSKH